MNGCGGNFPHIQFARYADDAVIHARSLAEAEQVLEAVRSRLLECGWNFILKRRRSSTVRIPTVAAVTTRSSSISGLHVPSTPSEEPLGKAVRQLPSGGEQQSGQLHRATIRSWRLGATRNNQSLEEIAKFVNPYRTRLGELLWSVLPNRLSPRCCVAWNALWCTGLAASSNDCRRHQRRAVHWLGRVARREPNLFEMWRIGIRPATGQ